MLSLSGLKSLNRLILYFDVNMTVVTTDVAANLSLEESLNKNIAHFAIVKKKNEFDDYCWHDGTPFSMKTNWLPSPISSSSSTLPVLSSNNNTNNNNNNNTNTNNTTTFPPLISSSRLPVDCYRFTDCFRGNKTFTEVPPGCIYRPLFNELMQNLVYNNSNNNNNNNNNNNKMEGEGSLYVTGKDGALYHMMLPAFFHTLLELKKNNVNFLVVLRTFGIDLPKLHEAMDLFAKGKHPDFRDNGGSESHPLKWCQFSTKSNNHYVLRKITTLSSSSSASSFTASYQLKNSNDNIDDDESFAISTPEELAHFFEEKEHPTNIIAIQDDYNYWKASNYAPQAGKPIFLNSKTVATVRHIFLDDNIHYLANDSIVSIHTNHHLEDSDDDGSNHPYWSLTGEEMLELHDRILVKAAMWQAILDKDYFLKKIIDCCSKPVYSFKRSTTNNNK